MHGIISRASCIRIILEYVINKLIKQKSGIIKKYFINAKEVKRREKQNRWVKENTSSKTVSINLNILVVRVNISRTSSLKKRQFKKPTNICWL